MKRILFGIALMIPFFCIAQIKNIGTPSVVNYTKSVYNGGTQNWDIAQDQNGFMYFANNNGLLKFDGFLWEFIEGVPEGMVRSVMVDSQNRIFVGLLYDFGIIVQDNNGKYKYKSLLDLVPEDKKLFNDVWKIHEIDKNIVFQTYERMFVYTGQEVKVLEPENQFHFSFNVNGRLFVQDRGVGLFEVSNNKMTKVPWAGVLKDTEIWSILEIEENSLLIGTANNGFYFYDKGKLSVWDTELNTFVKSNKLFSAKRVAGNYFAFGSVLRGLVLADENGKIVQQINRGSGLLNNTILSVFTDKDKNLWLGLDNGIAYVEINSPLSYIANQGEIGTGYCCEFFDNKLYVGTNQGLFVRSFNTYQKNDEKFQLVENTEGQVWSLTIHDGQLICGHNFGTFIVKDKTAIKILDEPGAWNYISLKDHPDILLGGHYRGLDILKKGNNGWEFRNKVKGFDESSRFLYEEDDGAIWMSHGGKGIYRLVLNEKVDSVSSFKLYGKKNGLPQNTQNILFRLKERLYVSTVNGVYEYSSFSDTFLVADEVNKIFGLKERLKTVKTDNSGNIWYISENESGVLRPNEDLSYTKITGPFEALNRNYVSEFEFIYPFNNDHTLWGIDNGFAHYSSKFSKSFTQGFNTFITKVELSNIDSVIYPINISKSEEHVFPYKQNSFRFHYTSPFFENIAELKFSYKLENYSGNWSEWTSDSYKDFTNLNEGVYRFKVKAKNVYETESELSDFSFRIDPPWYRSDIALIIYLLLSALLIYFLVRLIFYRIELAKKKEKLKHEKQIKEQEEIFQHQSVVAEKEIIKLRNEKLRADMIHRDKELANQTNSIIQKNKFLRKLNDELKLLQNSTDDASVRTKIAILKKRISKETENKQQRVFETYFDQVHEAFFERLKKKFPQLSPKDLRLCAYIRMNISTKEIATLLNISDRGVEITRYRLRKKLELSREINLSTFLAGI